MKKRIVLIFIFSILLIFCDQEEKPEFSTFPKFDAHVHYDSFDQGFAETAREHNFKLMTLVTRSASQEHIDREFAWAHHQHEKNPNLVYFSTTFSMENWDDPNWQSRTIAKLQEHFDKGAIAVKIWKDIGMTFRREDDSFIMIDDPMFDPILNFIASQNKVVVGHLGEPRNCWLPLDSMTVRSDSSYFADHPQYHMYLHPEYPSYEEQIAARDRVLEKHPDLTFIGAHLGSLEWNVDELAKRLDNYPNFAVDMAARICHYQVQDRDKVRQFIIDYQDRLLYGTDLGVRENSQNLQRISDVWQRHWRYFTTADSMTSSKVRQPFQGLDLPAEVLQKMYYENAVNWLGIKL